MISTLDHAEWSQLQHLSALSSILWTADQESVCANLVQSIDLGLHVRRAHFGCLSRGTIPSLSQELRLRIPDAVDQALVPKDCPTESPTHPSLYGVRFDLPQLGCHRQSPHRKLHERQALLRFRSTDRIDLQVGEDLDQVNKTAVRLL